MTDKDKKPNYLLWIILGIGALLLVLGITFYLLWRKSTGTEIKMATMSKSIEDIKVKTAQSDTETRNKDEKIQKLTQQVSDLINSNTELKYQLKEIKKTFGGKSKVSKKQVSDDTFIQDLE